MKNLPQASLIMSTYNRVDALELCLLSAFQQAHLPSEIIVADDGSTESTRLLVERLQKQSPVPLLHVWHADEGFQLAKIRNKAVAKSQFEYVISIDADQILHPCFVQDHLSASRKGVFLQGHRVLLDAPVSEEVLQEKRISFSILEEGLSNKKNAFRALLLRDIFKGAHKRLKGVRGCNMSFWKEDLRKVNGFNEAFVGWGREDSELVIRLYNSGILRSDLYFSAIVYHLFHIENSKKNLLSNDKELEQALLEKRTYCKEGLDQYEY
ncbi:MAG: glycosyltransferase family 2 protein [Bdellovibrionota bacterium]